MFPKYIFYSIFLISHVKPELSQTKCAENTGLCIVEFLKSWEIIRLKEVNTTSILLPNIYYTKESLSILCDNYQKINEKCGIESCPKLNELATFVVSHFSFICDNEMFQKYLENEKCIKKVLIKSNCSTEINENPQIANFDCEKIDKFAKCVENPLKIECGNKSNALIQKMIFKYGCLEKIDIQQIDESLQSDEKLPEKVEASLEIFDKTEVEASSSTVIATTSEVNQVETTTLFNDILITNNDLKIVKKAFPRRISKKFHAQNMTDCYSSIVSDFGRFIQSNPSSKFVRLPLFGLKPIEIEVLCSKKDLAEQCVENFCVGNCRLPPVKSFVDSQLKEICKMRKMEDFDAEFMCLQNVLAENLNCLQSINTTTPNRCDGHNSFRKCILPKIEIECSVKAVVILDKIEKGFGCRLLFDDDEEEEEGQHDKNDIIEASGEGSGSGEEVGEEGESFEDPNLAETSLQTDVKLLSGKRSQKRVFCNEKTKINALSCLGPFLRLWTGIKANRKETETVFPMFFFTKFELLELCDSFVNYKFCLRSSQSENCANLPLIKFADQHFGQICTIQQIEASIRVHDCINALDTRTLLKCDVVSKGDTLPEKRKCNKVRLYTSCLRNLVASYCGHLMLAQYDVIVNKFGC